MASPSFPIFYDPTGRRWKYVVFGTACAILVLMGIAAWMTPGAIAPIWTPPLNQDRNYPHQVLESAQVEDIPLIGDVKDGILNRVVLIKHDPDESYLVDPYTNAVLRAATEEEKEQIGTSPYAMESYGRPADHQLMLTFDDGPDALYTPELLDLLSREKVPATFFVIGKSAVKHPDVLERTIREGHLVANHTMTHLDFDTNTDLRNREELVGTDHVLRATAGYATRLFRIPEGDPDNNALALLQSQQLGYLHIDMDVDTRDWGYQPGQSIEVPALDGRGHVVLMHDGGGDRSETVKMVETLIAQAKSQGYTFSTVAPLIPSEYMPIKDVPPTIADRATLGALQLIWVIPNKLVGWLFWFGVGSLTIMSIFYVFLALANQYVQTRRKWPAFSDEEWPFVSVVLPVYNEEVVIQRTLSALRASDYPSSQLEVIVVNDGSTDDTLSILQEYARDWLRLRVYDQPNGGKSSASNRGIKYAKGEIVVTLDGDTIFEPQTIRMLVRHFVVRNRKGKQIGAVAGHIKVGNRRNILTAWQSLEYISGICVTRMAEGFAGAISIVPGACAAWRREVLLAAGGYSEETMAEDADLTLAIQHLGYGVAQENRAVAWTEAPMTIRSLAKQRLRWTYGNIQALRKHHKMILRPRYKMLGMVALPYALLSLLVPLLFMPLTVVVAALSIIDGNWQSVALFATFVAMIHMVISIIAIAMVREKSWHLLVVPIYRLIYEPLRAYLLYASLIRVIKGRVVGWNKVERTNSVVSPSAT